MRIVGTVCCIFWKLFRQGSYVVSILHNGTLNTCDFLCRPNNKPVVSVENVSGRVEGYDEFYCWSYVKFRYALVLFHMLIALQ